MVFRQTSYCVVREFVHVSSDYRIEKKNNVLQRFCVAVTPTAYNGNLHVFVRVKPRHVCLTIENIWIFRFEEARVNGLARKSFPRRASVLKHPTGAPKEIDQKRT